MWELEIVRERDFSFVFARVHLSHMEFSAADGFCHLTFSSSFLCFCWANEDLCEITPDSTLNPSAGSSFAYSRAQLFQQKKRKKAEITTQIIIMGFNRRLSSSSLRETQKRKKLLSIIDFSSIVNIILNFFFCLVSSSWVEWWELNEFAKFSYAYDVDQYSTSNAERDELSVEWVFLVLNEMFS